MKLRLSDRGRRRALAIVIGLAAGGAVFFLRRAGLLQGVQALVFAAFMVLLLPWSDSISGRLLLGGSTYLGWMPLLWWVPLPVPLDRVGIVLALIFGGLVCWLLWTSDIGARARRLVPRAKLLDVAPFAAAGAALWVAWPLIVVRDGTKMLNVLMKAGYDHASHAAMVMQIRDQGAIVPVLGNAPDGSAWQWVVYPQHYHAANVSVTELLRGPDVGSMAQELVTYGRSLALLQVFIVMLLCAGVVRLPNLRNRSLLAWPVAAMVVAAYTFGPGSHAMSLGQPNFVMACATAGLAALLATQMSGGLKPSYVFVLGGLVVATVHGWALLVPMAIVGAAAALVPVRRNLWPRGRGTRIKLVAALVATLAACLAVIPMLNSAGGTDVLTLGELTSFDIHLEAISLVLLTGGMAAASGLAAWVRRRDGGEKGVVLALAAVAGVLTLIAVAVYELVTVGKFGYYFGKLETGVTLVAFVVLAAGISINLAPSSTRLGRGRRAVAVLATALAVVAALQVQSVEGVRYHYKAKQLTDVTTPEAQRLFDAATLAKTRPFGSTVYVAAMPDDPRGQLAENWFAALSIEYTAAVEDINDNFRHLIDTKDGMDLDEAVTVAAALLEEDRERSVIVAPEILDSIRAQLPVDVRDRVVTWVSP